MEVTFRAVNADLRPGGRRDMNHIPVPRNGRAFFQPVWIYHTEVVKAENTEINSEVTQ